MLADFAGYSEFLITIKQKISTAQVRASVAVTTELALLYWQIGREILVRQQEQGWGSQIIDRLSTDLRKEFPQMRGFSRTNLHYMRAFAQVYPNEQFVHQVGGQIPWRHNVYLLDTVKVSSEREWYIRATIENGWRRAVLMHQIESGLYHRQGKAQTNFAETLPTPHPELVQQMLKDPYNFDFLTISKSAHEREVHHGLLVHIREFLLELGKGFAFVGSEYPLDVSGQEYFLDLLFYHLHLRRFVVIELKTTEFQPEYSGKMNFYLSAVDALLRHVTDEPSIGIILCKSKDRLIVEYALRDMSKPIGVSEYYLNMLPDQLSDSLPSVEELEAEFGPDTDVEAPFRQDDPHRTSGT